MRYLFIVDDMHSANGICINSVKSELLKRGHQVFILTSYNCTLSDNTIQTLNPPFFKKCEIIANNTTFKINRAIFSFISGFIVRLFCLVHLKSFPWITPTYTKHMYTVAKSIVLNQNIDFVIPVYSRIDSLIVAFLLKKTMNIPYYAYFLDPLEAGHWPKYLENKRMELGSKWEEMIISISEGSIFMSSTKTYYQSFTCTRLYLQKVIFLGLPLYSFMEKPHTCATNEIRIKNWILYAGSLPLKVRPVDYLFQLFNKEFPLNVEVNLIGNCSNEKILQKKITKDSLITYRRQVSKEMIDEYYLKADILLSLGNNNNWMIPSKIFEYMSFGKPIIHLALTDLDPCINYLDQYPMSLVLIKEKQPLCSDRSSLANFIMKFSGKTTSEDLCEKFYFNTPMAVVDYLENTDFYAGKFSLSNYNFPNE